MSATSAHHTASHADGDTDSVPASSPRASPSHRPILRPEPHHDAAEAADRPFSPRSAAGTPTHGEAPAPPASARAPMIQPPTIPAATIHSLPFVWLQCSDFWHQRLALLSFVECSTTLATLPPRVCAHAWTDDIHSLLDTIQFWGIRAFPPSVYDALLDFRGVPWCPAWIQKLSSTAQLTQHPAIQHVLEVHRFAGGEYYTMPHEEKLRRVIHVAVHQGSVALLRYARETHACQFTPKLLQLAIVAGHLDVVDYMYRVLTDDVEACLHHGVPSLIDPQWAKNTVFCAEAARHGRLDCLAHLHEVLRAPWCDHTLFLAFRQRHWECVTYACQHGCPMPSVMVRQWAVGCRVVDTPDEWRQCAPKRKRACFGAAREFYQNIGAHLGIVYMHNMRMSLDPVDEEDTSFGAADAGGPPSLTRAFPPRTEPFRFGDIPVTRAQQEAAAAAVRAAEDKETADRADKGAVAVSDEEDPTETWFDAMDAPRHAAAAFTSPASNRGRNLNSMDGDSCRMVYVGHSPRVCK